MSRWTLRILAPLALLALLAGSAEAGVGDSGGGALSSLGRLSLVQTVQYGGDCWYDNGSNGPGYYPCGDEWDNGLGGAAPSAQSLARRSGAIIATEWSLRIPGVKPRLSQRAVPPWRSRLSCFAGSTPAPRPSPAGLPAADSTAALAAAIFISFTAPEFPTSARQSRPAMLSAAGFMGLAGQRESTSGGLSHQVLPAAVSMPVAHWERPTSARPLHWVLPAAGVMALEGAELSRAAARGSDKAA